MAFMFPVVVAMSMMVFSVRLLDLDLVLVTLHDWGDGDLGSNFVSAVSWPLTRSNPCGGSWWRCCNLHCRTSCCCTWWFRFTHCGCYRGRDRVVVDPFPDRCGSWRVWAFLPLNVRRTQGSRLIHEVFSYRRLEMAGFLANFLGPHKDHRFICHQSPTQYNILFPNIPIQSPTQSS